MSEGIAHTPPGDDDLSFGPIDKVDMQLITTEQPDLPPLEEVEEEIFRRLREDSFNPKSLDRKTYQASATIIGITLADYAGELFNDQPPLDEVRPTVFKIPGNIGYGVTQFLHRNGRGFLTSDPYQRRIAVELMVGLSNYATKQHDFYPEILLAHNLESRWSNLRNVALTENAAIVLAAQGLILNSHHRALMYNEIPAKKTHKNRRDINYDGYYEGGDDF
jgi:hypothetical protein